MATASANATRATAAARRWGLRAHPEHRRTGAAIAAAWLLLVAATAIHRSDFLAHDTVLAVAFTMAITGVLSVGVAVVAISGGLLDLSVPAALALSELVGVKLAQQATPTALLVVLVLAAGTAWGLLNATIVVLGRVNPLIVTLGTNFAGVGLLNLEFDRQVMPRDAPLRSFGNTQILGLPSVWWVMLALIVLTAAALTKTRYGRRMTAVGGNPVAARQRGISLRKTRFAVFMFAGFCGGIAGLLFIASNSTVLPTDGDSFLLPVVAAVILAGMSLRGGRGQVLLLVLSGGFLATVPTSLAFFGLAASWQEVMQGLLLMIAVSIDGWQRKRAAAR